MSVKRFSGQMASASAHNRDRKHHEEFSPPRSSFWALPDFPVAPKAGPAGKDAQKWFTPPTTSDSNAFPLKTPASPSKRGSSRSKYPTPTQKVMFQELMSSQLELDDVPDDAFFLVAPTDVFSPIETPAPQIVRPRAHRVGDIAPGSPLNAIAPQGFQCIDDDVDESRSCVLNGPSIMFDQDYPAALTQVPRLKPRPSSRRDGKRDWESIALFADARCGYGEEHLG